MATCSKSEDCKYDLQQHRLDVNKLSEEQLYLNVHIWSARKLLITKYKHNHVLWNRTFHHYSNQVNQNPSLRHNHWIYFKRLRKLIYHQTNAILKQGYYTTNDKTIILNQNLAFEKSIQLSKCYKDTRKLLLNKQDEIKQDKESQTIVEILNGDCIDAGHKLLNDGYNPIVLNCGGSRHGGGGWKDGAGAQEENLFRRTSYSVALNENTNCALYPIPKYGCLYSPNIIVFRGNEITQGYKLLDKPFELSFIIGCMIRHPKYNKDNGKYAKELRINQIICDKIRSIFRVSLYNKHDSIVLTAWGCGDFGNKPQDIAALFKIVINENEFKNKFKKIVFAILEDHNTKRSHNPEGNLQPFINVFNSDEL